MNPDAGHANEHGGEQQQISKPGFRSFESFSPEEKLVFPMIRTCAFQCVAVSGFTALLVYKSAGKLITQHGNPFMKRWQTFIKVAASFGIFDEVRRLCGNTVCMKRIENLPQSPLRDNILNKWKNGEDFGDAFNEKQDDNIMPLGPSDQVEIPPQNEYPQFDNSKHGHETHNTSNFDHSNNYSPGLPPISSGSGYSAPSRRNKYGDLVEEL